VWNLALQLFSRVIDREVIADPSYREHEIVFGRASALRLAVQGFLEAWPAVNPLILGGLSASRRLSRNGVMGSLRELVMGSRLLVRKSNTDEMRVSRY
jgi:hypothetical protein